jgi:triphosphoribosyl-dephospho-CoA synthase
MQCLAERTAPPAEAARTGETVGLLAARALFAELACFPKPGLVSFRDRGSNRDMDAALFLRSILALRPYFASLARAGYLGEPFESLRRIGVDAEDAMRVATGGVNTHRGAIFSLGLLAAGAGSIASTGGALTAPTLAEAVLGMWGDGIAAHAPPCGSHGTRARVRFGASGACGEAARGFPSVVRVGLPALEDAIGRGCDFNSAMTQAFFNILVALDDTNLLHRGGREGLVFARECASLFLSAGGVFAPGWRARALDIHARVVARGLNPGGAGDMLACAAFVHFASGTEPEPFRNRLATEDAGSPEVHRGRSLSKKRRVPVCGTGGAAWASR